AAYGFLVPSREIGRILREDCSRDGLLPPALTGDVPTDSLVYITVATAS
ncbi:MAG: hypothetical protein GWN71_36045, partial [Gammaproteobacteria bacterium]|nr:hypothetical protein [Gemmatimonadota bacterium]NIU78771.1 hypothetical protein [Gammaproteobacteria bacterium]